MQVVNVDLLDLQTGLPQCPRPGLGKSCLVGAGYLVHRLFDSDRSHVKERRRTGRSDRWTVRAVWVSAAPYG